MENPEPENASQQYSEPGPCTLEHALWHLDTHSSLPAAASLKTASAAEVGRIVECEKLAPFLKDFLPAAFGARSDRCADAPRPPLLAISPRRSRFAGLQVALKI